MKISDLAVLGGGVQALLVTFVVIAANTAGINGDAEPFAPVAAAMEGLALEQFLHHFVLERLNLLGVEQFDDVMN